MQKESLHGDRLFPLNPLLGVTTVFDPNHS